MPESHFEAGSFRDRTARVFHGGGAIYRSLNGRALAEWEELRATRFFARGQADGRIIGTERVDTAAVPLPASSSPDGVLRHERVPFVSYPYEWSFGMLRSAALLHLQLMDDALAEGMILKDASAYNVQWRGLHPVFIDVSSFERLRTGEPWTGYRQFCQMFLYPLMLQAYRGVPFQPWMRGCLDGIEPADCRRLMSARDALRPGVLAHVLLQAGAEARYGDTDRDVKRDLRAAGFGPTLIQANVRGLAKLVGSLRLSRASSAWVGYANDNSYSPADAAAKRAFVERALRGSDLDLVWDLGCNTGMFTRLAAARARYVVALDADAVVVDRLFLTLSSDGVDNVLPLVGNLADPSPSLGWRGRERRTLLDRGRPTLVLCLALLHHLVITNNIPMVEVVDWLGALGADLVLEFVQRDDPMVERLIRHKDEAYADYDERRLQTCLDGRFHVEAREPLPSGRRVLYHARART